MDKTFFLNSPFIKMIAKYPNWTLSNPNKAPLNAKKVMQGNYQAFYSYKNQGLVTLPEIFPYAKPGYRLAFRLNTLKTHIMAFDIEKDRSPSWDQKLKDLPYSYVEQSMHGGIHAFMQITADKYHSSTYREFLNATTTELQALEKNSNHKGVEFLFNNHFITFTGNRLPDQNSDYLTFVKQLTYLTQNQTQQTRKQYVKLINQANQKQTQFFNQVLLPLKRSEKIHAKQNLKIDNLTKEKALNAIRRLRNDGAFYDELADISGQCHKIYQKGLTKYYHQPSDKLAGQPDMSRIEWGTLCSLRTQLKNKVDYDTESTITSAFKNCGLNASKPNELAIFMYELIMHLHDREQEPGMNEYIFLKYRPKWEEPRPIGNWLLYQCNQVTNALQALDNQKGQDKKHQHTKRHAYARQNQF